MIAMVTRRPIGIVLSWGFLLGMSGLAGTEARAQTQKKAAETKKGAAAKEAPKEKPPELPREITGPEVFRDNRARALLDNNFHQLFRQRTQQPALDKQFRDMAEKGAPNPQLIQQYVQAQARELTDHKNIESMLDVAGEGPDTRKAPVFKALEEATERLTIALETANVRKNPAFRKEVVKALIAPGVGDELLKNHLYARTQYLIALAISGDPLAVDPFIAVLGDPEQPSVLKLLAARGIEKIVSGGAKIEALDGSTRIRCARAVSDFLKAESDGMWPALDQGLQTLGALRQDSFDPSKGDLEFLITAMTFLARSDAPVDVRSRAAWAIGMLRISPNTRVNYRLIAHHAGHVGVELAEHTLADYDATSSDPSINDPAKEWVAQLVTRVVFGLKGDPKLGESGILPMAARGGRGEDLKAVETITTDAVDLAKSAVTLIQSAGTLRAQEKNNTTKATSELRGFLTKNPPKDVALFPKGPEFPIESAAHGADKTPKAAP